MNHAIKGIALATAAVSLFTAPPPYIPTRYELEPAKPSKAKIKARAKGKAQRAARKRNRKH